MFISDESTFHIVEQISNIGDQTELPDKKWTIRKIGDPFDPSPIRMILLGHGKSKPDPRS